MCRTVGPPWSACACVEPGTALADETLAQSDGELTPLVRVGWGHFLVSVVRRIFAAASCPSDGALFALMGRMGLRVSEACTVQIEDFQDEVRGHRALRLTGKGNKDATMPLPEPVLRALLAAASDRTTGPVVLTKRGTAQNRRGAYGRCKILVKRPGLPAGTHPHTMRHAAITAALDAGAPLRDV
ncbi:hypothetical protein E3T41_09540 [Cryobacterium sp. Hh38]|nr:hypothetical protein E3T41_09540 [Cryobacterium sp. Hh38]